MSVKQTSLYVIGATDINANSKQTIRPYIVRAPGNVGITKYKRKQQGSVTPMKSLNAKETPVPQKFGYPMYDSKPSAGSSSKSSGSKPGSKPPGPQPPSKKDVTIKTEKLKIETVVKPTTPKPERVSPKSFPMTPTTQEKLNKLNDLVQLVDSPNTIDKLKKLKDLDKLKKPPTLISTKKPKSPTSPVIQMDVDLPIKKRPAKKRVTNRATPYPTKKPNVKKPKSPDDLKEFLDDMDMKNRLKTLVKPAPVQKRKNAGLGIDPTARIVGQKRKNAGLGIDPTARIVGQKRKNAGLGILTQNLPKRKFSASTLPVITNNKAEKRKGSWKQSDKFKIRKGDTSTEPPSYVRIVGQKRRNVGLKINTQNLEDVTKRRMTGKERVQDKAAKVPAKNARDPRAKLPAVTKRGKK